MKNSRSWECWMAETAESSEWNVPSSEIDAPSKEPARSLGRSLLLKRAELSTPHWFTAAQNPVTTQHYLSAFFLRLYVAYKKLASCGHCEVTHLKLRRTNLCSSSASHFTAISQKVEKTKFCHHSKIHSVYFIRDTVNLRIVLVRPL